ncbi:protein transport protein Sec24A [Aplochiton taeniatus]
MSSTGFNSQNGEGGQPYTNGPSQNPIALQQQQQPGGPGYNMASQPPYNQMQAKAPVPPGAGLYNSGLYQPVPPATSFQPVPPATSFQPLTPATSFQGASLGHPLLNRPGMGAPSTLTPPQSATPSPGPSPVPRMPQLQGTPPPLAASNNYHPSPQPQPTPAWQYAAPPQMGAPCPIPAPPLGPPMGNHVTSTASTAPPPPSSAGYNVGAPPTTAYLNATQPPGPGLPPTTLHGYTQPGSAPPPMNPMAPHSYPPGRASYGPPATGPPQTMRPPPPPTGPPLGHATSPPPSLLPSAQCGDGANSTLSPSALDNQEGDIECPGPVAGNGPQASNTFNHLDTGNKMAGPPPPQPGPPGLHMGHSYPSLPLGYQTSSSGPNATYMHPTMQQPYSQASQPYQQPPLGPGPAQLSPSLAGLSLQGQTPEALRVVNLLQERNLLPQGAIPAPTPCLPQDLQKINCNPEVFRSTLTSIPQTQSLLNKAKLPLGLLLHPFKDLSQLPVVTSSTIVRCRSCRTYINPFVSFLDQRRWKCNLCFRVNDVPEEFMYNPVSRSYGEPHKRPEVLNATIEFIAPSEYMLRPPQPAVYLFALDVSHNAVETGYLDVVCQSLLENINALPGDSRTKIGFITFDSTIHFYNLQEGLSQPQMLIVSDIEDIFLPTPDSLLVNLNECKELVQDLLKSLPHIFAKTMETQSALGPTLQSAFKLLSPTGGRVSVFQTQLPNIGVGALKSREDPNQRASAKDIQHLSPATDFYKKLALDCSGQQVAVDLFLLSSQYCDLASLGCISRYSAGSVYYYPSYHHQHNPAQVERFQKDLKRYITRKIGFEAVMRIRCTKGMSIHTFHGNFFVRSTDLLSLPNVNPDAGFAVQMSIEENLVDMQVVSFQAALLYTSSKGERRIRVHTMCLPVVNSLSDIFAGADVQAITGLLASMAVDRSVTASLGDARDAMTNAAIDSLAAYRTAVLTIQQPGLLAPACLRLFPLYILALLKQKSFRTGTSTRLDDRVFAMCQLKYQPLAYVMLMIHPALYRLDDLTDEGALNVSERSIPQPRVLQLSVEKLSREGAFLMDAGSVLYLWIGKNCNPHFLTQVLGAPNYGAVPQNLTVLPELDTAESQRTRAFIGWLREQRPFYPSLHVIRDESQLKANFMQNMIEDRTESALSYYEFLLHIQQQVSK